MVRNGVEYGLTAADAEGFNILNHADAAPHERFSSRAEAAFADRVLLAMRVGSGGHQEGKG